MAVTVGNLLVGFGTIEIPTGTDIGATRGGVILQRETEVLEINDIDQVMGTAEAVKYNERWTLRTEVLESTQGNLNKLLELENAPAGNVLDFGGDADHATIGLKFYGEAPNGYVRTVEIYKARVIEVGEISFTRDGLTAIPVTFLLINDLTKASGKEVGQITDAVA